MENVFRISITLNFNRSSAYLTVHLPILLLGFLLEEGGEEDVLALMSWPSHLAGGVSHLRVGDLCSAFSTSNQGLETPLKLTRS